MNDSFYNTTHEVNPDLARHRQAATKQDDLVLDFYRRRAGELFTPSEVWQRAGFAAQDVPLTSVRRAITNLTDEGRLVKTTVRRIGFYSHNEFCWVYPRDNGGRAVVGGDLLL